MKTYKELLEKKSGYEVYHKSYSGAISELMKYLKKHKLQIDSDTIFDEITTGPARPKDGQTNRFNFLLWTMDEEPAMKGIAVQIAGLSKSFELNMYFTKTKAKDYR